MRGRSGLSGRGNFDESRIKMELTVKERHQENFAYRLESLMGRHRENP